MDLSTFIVSVFCLIDDRLGGKPIRSRGPSPQLSDSEVITMEVVGEFLGTDTDTRATTSTSNATTRSGSRGFLRSTAPPSPVRRPTSGSSRSESGFTCASPALHLLEHELLAEEGLEEPLLVVDAFPIPVCKRSRSYECRVMRDLADRGRGWVLADRNHWSPELRERLSEVEGGPMLMARFKRKNETEKERGLVWPRWLSAKRQKINTLFWRLVGRFNMKKVRTKDSWHFSSRFLRKILSHTVAVIFCRREGLPPTRFWQLLTD